MIEGGGEPLSADLGPDAATLGDLFSAVIERRRIRFGYRGGRRSAAPYGLAHRHGHWYLVAAGSDGTRTFRVDRMESVELGEEAGAFERPAGFRAAAAVAVVPWEAGNDEVTAVVRFEAAVAWWARRQLPGGAAVEEHRDGSITVRMRVSAVESFIGWLIAFEDGALIQSPPALRARFLAHLEESV